MNVGQPSTASPYQQPYNAYPQQVPQQPAAPQQPYDPYQQAQAGLAASGATPYAPQYSAGGAVGGIPSPGTSAYGQPPLNQLYTTDLLRELPPPISDLSLPPPPIILPPNAAVVPTSEDSNANPEYFRSTLNVIPNNHSLLKKTKLPLALVVRPYGDLHIDSENIPVASDTLIARCRRCRGYINPFITLTEQGRRWRCNFCNLQNDIPSGFEYDAMHNPKNKFERPELNHAVVEFIAPKEYMARAPQPVVFTFIIDVSADAVSSGLTSTITRTILESLDRIPNDKKTTKVAFIGVDSNLHFFRFNEGLDGIESLIVSDIDEPFLPSPEGLLVNLDENRPAIEKLLIDFPTFFEGTANVNFALGPALKAGHKMISSIGGKLICFAATLPNLGEDINDSSLKETFMILDLVLPLSSSTTTSIEVSSLGSSAFELGGGAANKGNSNSSSDSCFSSVGHLLIFGQYAYIISDSVLFLIAIVHFYEIKFKVTGHVTSWVLIAFTFIFGF
ncbi:COPII subunit [Cerrena zonata]|uniref:COPII subunit n=1 Tax=Cerrena zonata TaxID=2478898 RepID=A0AAW0FK36_9APHY